MADDVITETIEDGQLVVRVNGEFFSSTPCPSVGPTEVEIEAARTSLAAATTVAQTKARSLALDELRAAQIAALSPVT